MSWFSDIFKNRVGSAPKMGFFEDEQEFRRREFVESKTNIIRDANSKVAGPTNVKSLIGTPDEAINLANESLWRVAMGKEPAKGILENETEFRDRIKREVQEQVIRQSDGKVPARGFTESADEYRERLTREVAQAKIRTATGLEPEQRFFESKTEFESRLDSEARAIDASSRVLSTEFSQSIVERATDKEQKQGFFESDESFNSRMNEKAYYAIIEKSDGETPKQGFFESVDDYERRIRDRAIDIVDSGFEWQEKSDEYYDYNYDDDDDDADDDDDDDDQSVSVIDLASIPIDTKPKNREKDLGVLELLSLIISPPTDKISAKRMRDGLIEIKEFKRTRSGFEIITHITTEENCERYHGISSDKIEDCE